MNTLGGYIVGGIRIQGVCFSCRGKKKDKTVNMNRRAKKHRRNSKS